MKICFVTPRFPFPTRTGDRHRPYRQIRELSRDHSITLVSTPGDAFNDAALEEMRKWCARIEVVPVGGLQSVLRMAWRAPSTTLPLQTLYYESTVMRRKLAAVLAAERYDVVHVTTLRMLPYVWRLASPPVVVDLVDSQELGFATRRDRAPIWARPLYEFERRRAREYERAACRRFPRLIVAGAADKEDLGYDNVDVLRTGADLDIFTFELNGRDSSTVIMTGNMGYQPNQDAAVWFVQEIWPWLRRARPELRFQIVGARPTSAVRALARQPGVEVTGPVDDMPAYLRRATVAVVPIRCGAGIQTKLLEAMASGTPAVATTAGNQGVAGVPGEHLLVEDSAEGFARAALRLIDDPALRARLARNARRYMLEEFTWATHARRLEELYAAVLAGTADGRVVPAAAMMEGRMERLPKGA
jgi:polysaccharide biosynthesis protein PslH